MKKVNYHNITETPGTKASEEQLQRTLQRYRFAKDHCEDKEVLEVACGTGIGLGYLAETAKSVTGGDIDEKNLKIAREINVDKKNIQIDFLDAHEMHYQDNSFDVVLLFEAIYYLGSPGRFLQEAHRVLKPKGKLIICTVNKDWDDFHPSPYVTSYVSVPELNKLAGEVFSLCEFYGGFKVDHNKSILNTLKKVALKFNLIPGSLKARAYLKRVFMGKLLNLPPQVNDLMADYHHPEEILPYRVNKDYKIIYVVAVKS